MMDCLNQYGTTQNQHLAEWWQLTERDWKAAVCLRYANEAALKGLFVGECVKVTALATSTVCLDFILLEVLDHFEWENGTMHKYNIEASGDKCVDFPFLCTTRRLKPRILLFIHPSIHLWCQPLMLTDATSDSRRSSGGAARQRADVTFNVRLLEVFALFFFYCTWTLNNEKPCLLQK